MIHPNTHPNLAMWFPLSADLGLEPVDAGPGFDTLELEKALGEERYSALMNKVKQVFCCAHALYPEDHALAGREVHCVYAADLEDFLKAGG